MVTYETNGLPVATTASGGRSSCHPLAEFIKARRAAVRPRDVGLVEDGRRRVPGLRRAEVAELAGVSVAYYTHLEQGRDRHPSTSVCDALARPLQLDEPALRYLKRLAEGVSAPAGSSSVERVSPAILRVVDGLVHNPAIVLGRYRDVLAANRLATAVNPGFTVGRNILRNVFLDPAARDIFGNWDEVAAEAVRTLRMATLDHREDPVLVALVDELSHCSERFRRAWERHEVKEKVIGEKRFNRTPVGPITLGYETLAITGSHGQILSLYSAAAGSRDERALQELSAISTTDR